MPSQTPQPTRIYRLVHIESLPTLLARGALHAPNHAPDDGHEYRAIHNIDVQVKRRETIVPCGPGGTVHDYVPFYFGPLSVMLLNLKTGRVAGHTAGQAALIYLATTVQSVAAAGCRFVFSDGHGLATFTRWFDDLGHLDAVDWAIVRERYWADTAEDNDRQRRKQAEFLVWQAMDWGLIHRIGVIDADAKQQVEGILSMFPNRKQTPVQVVPDFYY